MGKQLVRHLLGITLRLGAHRLTQPSFSHALDHEQEYPTYGLNK